jgi:hypothetical protein
MANDVEQALVATAEPQECSRWAVIFLLSSVGATIVCFSLYVRTLYGSESLVGLLLAMLLTALGSLPFSLALIFVLEHYSGGNPYGVMSVDRLLSI